VKAVCDAQAHVDAATAAAAAAAGAAGAAAYLLAQGAPWAAAALAVQAGSAPVLALARRGRVEAVWDAAAWAPDQGAAGPGHAAGAAAGARQAASGPDEELDDDGDDDGGPGDGERQVPQIEAVAPAVVLLDAPGEQAGGVGGGPWVELEVTGRGLAARGCALVCRAQGRCLDVRVRARGRRAPRRARPAFRAGRGSACLLTTVLAVQHARTHTHSCAHGMCVYCDAACQSACVRCAAWAPGRRLLRAQVIDAWDAGGGRDAVRLRIPTSGLRAGAAWLEPQLGCLLGPARPLLLLPAHQAALAAEVRALVGAPGAPRSDAAQPGAPEAGAAATSGGAGARGGDEHARAAGACDSLLAELGLVLGARGADAGAEPPAGVGRIARRLLAFACDAGAPALAEAVLPAAAAGLPPAAAVAAVEAELPAGPPCAAGLLARTVRSGSAQMLDALLRWGGTAGHAWRADAPHAGDAARLTPLHLAALAPDGGALALRLLSGAAPAPGAWFGARAADGLTPADFAAHVGAGAVNVAAARLLGLGGLWHGASGGERGAPPAAGCGCGAACPVCSGPRGCRCGTRGFMCGFGCCGGGGGGAGGGGNGAGGSGGLGSRQGPHLGGEGGISGAGCCGGGAQASACCP